MTVLLKASFYLKPDENFYSIMGYKRMLEDNLRYMAREGMNADLYQVHVEESLPFDGDDFEYLQNENCDLALLEQHFPIYPAYENLDYPWKVQVGQWYKHFKGKHIEIIEVAQHTENQQWLVVYKEWTSGKVWVRPLEMFCSKVDKEKYPKAKQEYRFEPIKKLAEGI